MAFVVQNKLTFSYRARKWDNRCWFYSQITAGTVFRKQEQAVGVGRPEKGFRQDASEGSTVQWTLRKFGVDG